MSRRLTLVALLVTAVVAFLVGAVVAGGPPRRSALNGAALADRIEPSARGAAPAGGFAEVVARVNPAVVNVEATSRVPAGRRRHRFTPFNDDEEPDPFDSEPNGRRDPMRWGAGSGFIIDPDGSILTNHHVIDRADRVVVKLADGRILRARVVGSDPDTDVALIKIDGQRDLPVAPLGDSSTLRVGEWVCAIGNPLGYEHSVTVGVVSFLGRKLFDQGLDDYIQTDAAINFGNSGGPLINARGEVIGISAAISSRASSIGFAVPINGAVKVLPQLRARGRVSRGFLGVTLMDVDADLDRTLHLGTRRGALVQDVTIGDPAERAGLAPYDVIVGLDEVAIEGEEQLIREVAGRAPGSLVRVRFVRDGREQTVEVRLAERPPRAGAGRPSPPARPRGRAAEDAAPLGLTLKEVGRATLERLGLSGGGRGVVITHVEPMSASFDAGIESQSVVLEINRQRVASAEDVRRLVRAARPGDVLALYLYVPDAAQRQIKIVRVEER